MQFQKGQSGNPAGRPRKARTNVHVPVAAQRKVLRAVTERAIDGDPTAQDALMLLMLTEATACGQR